MWLYFSKAPSPQRIAGEYRPSVSQWHANCAQRHLLGPATAEYFWTTQEVPDPHPQDKVQPKEFHQGPSHFTIVHFIRVSGVIFLVRLRLFRGWGWFRGPTADVLSFVSPSVQELLSVGCHSYNVGIFDRSESFMCGPVACQCARDEGSQAAACFTFLEFIAFDFSSKGACFASCEMNKREDWSKRHLWKQQQFGDPWWLWCT